MASLTRTIAPIEWPVDVDAVKAGLRIDGSDEDDLLETLIQAATEYAEVKLGRAILAQTWVLTLDRFPPKIRLPWPVVRTATVAYQATAGAWTTLDGAVITLAPGPPSYIWPAYTATWPVPIAHVDAVRVTFSAYSWATVAVVPAGIKQWIIAKVGELFAQRETSGPIQLYAHRFLDGLLAPWVVPAYGVGGDGIGR